MHRGAFSDINSTSLGYVHLRHGDDDDGDDDDDDNDDDDDEIYSHFDHLKICKDVFRH